MKIREIIFGSRRMVVGWNTLAQFVGKVASAGVMFLISLLIARNFGAGGFGDFTKITTYVAFYYLLADFGLNAVFLQKEQKAAGNWNNLLILRLVGSIFLIVVALSVLFFLPEGTVQGYTPLVRLGIILYSPTILFQALVTTANALFQKHLRYDLATLALLIGDIVSLVLVTLSAFMVFQGAGSVAAAASLMIGTAATGIISLTIANRLAGPTRLSLTIKSIKELLIAGLPLGIMLIFNQVYFRFDSFVLTLTRTTAEVGIYGLAYKIFELPLVLPTFFMNALYPIMLKEAIGDKRHVISQTLKNLTFKSFIFLLITSLLLLIAFWLAAPLLTLVRPEFSQSIPALRILILSLPLFFTTSLLMWIIVVFEEQKFLPLIYGLSMIFIVAADVIFIPRYGYISAAWITVAAEGLVLILLSTTILLLFKKTKGVKIRKL